MKFILYFLLCFYSSLAFSGQFGQYDALLMVDVWASCDSKVIENNLKAMSQAYEEGRPIILVEMFQPTHPDILKFASSIPEAYPFLKIVKWEADAFSEPELEKYLREINAHKILITGAYTDACIKATIFTGVKEVGLEFITSGSLLEGGAPDYVNELEGKLIIAN